jgi:hypothetical protein
LRVRNGAQERNEAMPEFERLPTRMPSGAIQVTNVKDVTSKAGVDYTILEFVDVDGKAQTFAKAQAYRQALRNLAVGSRVKMEWPKGSHVPTVTVLRAAEPPAPNGGTAGGDPKATGAPTSS